MCHIAVWCLVILPIDQNVLIRDLVWTVLETKFLVSLVKVILAQSALGFPSTVNRLKDYHTLDHNGSDNPSGGGGTYLATQVLGNYLWKLQLVTPIGSVLQGHILRYHELDQVSHKLGGQRDLGNFMCRIILGSSSLNADIRMVQAWGVRRPSIYLTTRE